MRICRYVFLCFLLFFVKTYCRADSKTSIFDIVEYGATQDTTVVQTRFIQAAIDACYNAGGGEVYIPAGKYVSGTIWLKDHVELKLAAGAYLLASNNYIDFPIIPISKYRSLKDISGWSALLFAENAKNIAITGQGTIDGRGRGKYGRKETVGGDRDGRPRNILFISCQNVKVTGVTLLNSAMWNQHYLNCEDVIVDKISVYNHANGNNDGIDIDGCRRFSLSNSIIDSDDDAIVLKSTGVAACDDILINNCIVSSFTNGIKCGTESTGGFKNIVVSNCIIRPSRHIGERIVKSTESGITGISLEIVDGGEMDGVMISNILIQGTECPFYIRLANRGRKYLEEAPEPPVGRMRNVSLSNITAYNVGNFGASITGIGGHRIENVSLDNIRIYNKGGLRKGNFTSKNVFGGRRHDVVKDLKLDSYWESFREVVEDDNGYPQPTIWLNLPCYGLFIRHVDRIEANNLAFLSNASEPRPAVQAIDVGNLLLGKMIVNPYTSPAIVINQVKKYSVDKSLKLKKEK